MQKGTIMKKDNKSIRFNFRLAENEFKFIEAQASLCDISVSEYIRRCSLNEEKIVIVDPERSIASSLGKIYSALSNHDELTFEDKKEIYRGLSGVVDTLHKVIEELK